MDETQYHQQVLTYAFPYLEWVITMQEFIQHYSKDNNWAIIPNQTTLTFTFNGEQLDTTPIIAYDPQGNMHWPWAEPKTYPEATTQHSRQTYQYLTQYGILPHLLKETTGKENIWGAILTGIYAAQKPFLWLNQESSQHCFLIEDELTLPQLTITTLALLLQTYTKAYPENYTTKDNLLTALQAYSQQRDFTVEEEDGQLTVRFTDGTFCDIEFIENRPTAIKYAQ